MFRWLVLLLLIYILGQYLEGPAYRVIVRDWTFVLASFALPLLSNQFLYQQKRLPEHTLRTPVLIANAVILPICFLYFVQHYYDGGKNNDYALFALYFSLLMGLNVVIYFVSLFVKPAKITHKNETNIDKVNINKIEVHRTDSESNQISYYELKLYYLDGDKKRGNIKFEEQGTSEPPQCIILPGFSKDIYIDLTDYWSDILHSHKENYSTSLTTRETIIKFGETLQLVDDYELTFKISY